MGAQYRGKVSFLVPGPGIATTGTLQTSGSTAQNATSIVLTATTLTGNMNYGDTFVISATTYTCTATTAAAAGSITVPVSPKVPSTINTATPATSYTVTRYAQDLVFLAPADAATVTGIGNTALLGVTACLTALTTGAGIELWLWDPLATKYQVVTNYYYGATLLTALGSTTQALASYPAAVLRCKSDGSHGDTIGSPGTTLLFSAD